MILRAALSYVDCWLEEAADGSLWMLKDTDPGDPFHLTPK